MSIAINAKQCVGCGKCSMVCPGSLIHMNADVRPSSGSNQQSIGG